MEKIYDLIDNTNNGYSIHHVTRNKKNQIQVPMTSKTITSFEDVCKILKTGQKYKKQASTVNNERSSRSHTVFALEFISRNKKGHIKRAKLNLIDLAGSERFENLGDDTTLQKESNNINKSLLHLGHCIYKLSLGFKKTSIPYRDSLLTRYLSDTLGGISNTVMICTTSKLKSNQTHTTMTLELGMRAQTIKTQPVQQLELSPAELKLKIKRLQAENKEMKVQITDLHKKLNSEQRFMDQSVDMSKIDQHEDNSEFMILENSQVSPNQLDESIKADIEHFGQIDNTDVFVDSNSSLHNEIAKLNKKSEEDDAKIKELTEKIGELEQKLTHNIQTIESLTIQLDVRQKDYQSQIAEKDAALQSEAELREKTLERMKVLQQQTLDLNEQLEKHAQESKTLKSELDTCQNDLKTREETNVEFTEMINENREEIDKLEAQKKKTDISLESAQDELSKANLKISDIESELEKLKKYNEETVTELSSVKSELSQKTIEQSEEITLKDATLKNQQTEIELLQKQLDADSSKTNEVITSLKETNQSQLESLTQNEKISKDQAKEIQEIKT